MQHYSLIDTSELALDNSAIFFEGALLAANFTTKALPVEEWLSALCSEAQLAQLAPVVTRQIHQQYNRLQRNEYSVTALTNDDEEALADFAEGFMSVWPFIEPQWQALSVSDGTARMLQALLTTCMLAIDETATREQMMAAGIEHPPHLAQFAPELDLMINEIALAADEWLTGTKAQAKNPFKGVGRNDLCPCGSCNKFKQCCGKGL